MKRSATIPLLLCICLLSSCAELPDTKEVTPVIHETEFSVSESTPEVAETEFVTSEPSVEPESAETPGDLAFGEYAREYLEAIAGDIGYREPGSAEEAQTAEYIQGEFEEMGYQPTQERFSAFDEEEEEYISSANVIAIKNGRSDEVIVVGAHYDAAYEEGTKGADDNASGVAVMMEVARLIYNTETPYTIAFVAFGAEELNLNGSAYYVENLSSAERGNIIGMFNLDSLIAGDKMYIYGNEGSGSMRDWVLADAKELGFKLQGKTDEEMNYEDGSPCECSDYDAFEKVQIPYAYFEATNWDLSPDAMIQVDPEFGSDGEIRHTEYDTIEYIDETFPGRIDEHLSLFSRLLYDLLIEYD